MARRHPGNLERRGDSFRARLCIRGQRFYVTIPTTDRAAAERIVREKAREFERKMLRTATGLQRCRTAQSSSIVSFAMSSPRSRLARKARMPIA